MTLLNTHNQKIEVDKYQIGYLVRLTNDTRKKKAKVTDTTGQVHEVDISMKKTKTDTYIKCFLPIRQKYNEAARIKHMELIKPKSYRYGR